MNPTEVVDALEDAIMNQCIGLFRRQKKANDSELDSLAKFVNAYSRLLERGINSEAVRQNHRNTHPEATRQQEAYDFEHGNPDYYEALAGGEIAKEKKPPMKLRRLNNIGLKGRRPINEGKPQRRLKKKTPKKN